MALDDQLIRRNKECTLLGAGTLTVGETAAYLLNLGTFFDNPYADFFLNHPADVPLHCMGAIGLYALGNTGYSCFKNKYEHTVPMIHLAIDSLKTGLEGVTSLTLGGLAAGLTGLLGYSMITLEPSISGAEGFFAFTFTALIAGLSMVGSRASYQAFRRDITQLVGDIKNYPA